MPGHHHFFCAEWRRLRKARIHRVLEALTANLTDSRAGPTVSWWQVLVIEDEARLLVLALSSGPVMRVAPFSTSTCHLVCQVLFDLVAGARSPEEVLLDFSGGPRLLDFFSGRWEDVSAARMWRAI